jgi:hypothetical protein
MRSVQSAWAIWPSRTLKSVRAGAGAVMTDLQRLRSGGLSGGAACCVRRASATTRLPPDGDAVIAPG